ncbi:class I SAM-dependent methyltransferase [Rhizobiaceae bacterium BDR2-2]|uniref:Class I SAM-dependent methyltransferase n=1 Tax=Ectorhizobium quercum TaxID=2965071 RepID=A0AAE3MVZ0_9HYPH|nr:class I SAM-dependent methyltransferase [Ectorhizobium quercum]MCX8996228.1 class I SAM-dependent methyltransferase [Ectorhizobium quercum]MCX8998733.1 class I SAM-dependent methyltransferase [Ectorhizobium quercum]
MEQFCSIMNIDRSVTVLDLGGQPMIWEPVDPSLDITILNLPGIAQAAPHSHHTIRYVEGDACNVTGYEDQSFDIVFSNSVIEHVGDERFRAAFAREVQRLGKSYWVQTPCKYFPIEPHNGMPFWWFYPASLRRFIVERWRRKLPAWTEMIDGTDIVSRKELERLFPEARVIVERFMGLPKSYIVFDNRAASKR